MNKIILTLALATLLLATWITLERNQVFSEKPGFCHRNSHTPTDLLISEYIEGSYNNKALEIYNGTGHPVTLTNHYTLFVSFNGGALQTALALTGTIPPGHVHVIAHPNATGTITGVANQIDTHQQTIIWNGNDAIVLYHGDVVIDSMGQISNTDYWGQDVTLIRRGDITAGDTLSDDPFDPVEEWIAYPKDAFNHLGSHTLLPRRLYLPRILRSKRPKL